MHFICRVKDYKVVDTSYKNLGLFQFFSILLRMYFGRQIFTFLDYSVYGLNIWLDVTLTPCTKHEQV